jgi:sec-independent protein translocase protein TatC
MALLFVAAEVIAHILDRSRARKVAAGELVATGGIEGDSALRELSDPDPDEPEPRP